MKNVRGKVELTTLFERREEQGELSSGDELKLKKLVRATERELLQAADVICVTCAGAGDPRLSSIRFRKVLSLRARALLLFRKLAGGCFRRRRGNGALPGRGRRLHSVLFFPESKRGRDVWPHLLLVVMGREREILVLHSAPRPVSLLALRAGAPR